MLLIYDKLHKLNKKNAQYKTNFNMERAIKTPRDLSHELESYMLNLNPKNPKYPYPSKGTEIPCKMSKTKCLGGYSKYSG